MEGVVLIKNVQSIIYHALLIFTLTYSIFECKDIKHRNFPWRPKLTKFNSLRHIEKDKSPTDKIRKPI